MQTFLGIETEMEYRRREYEREVEADVRAAQARPQNGRMRWSYLRRLVVARLRSLGAGRLAPTPLLPSPIARPEARPGT
jgi:hypothetical protein